MDKLLVGKHRPSKKNRSVIVIILILFSLLFLSLALKAIMQPFSVSEKVVDNRIVQRLSSDYIAAVKPSTLYPGGGKAAAIGTIFKNITDDLIFNFNVSFISEKPVIIDALQETTYILKAEDLWEREFILSDSEPVQATLKTNFAADEKVTLKLDDVYGFIKNVEDETANRSNYSLTVREKITGNIYDEDKNVVHAINLELLIPFEVFSQYMRYTGEPEGNEYFVTASIESDKVVPQKFSILGLSLSIVYSRIGFCIAALTSICLLLIMLLSNSRHAAEQPEDAGMIEKKNRRKIIPVTRKINLDAVTYISLDSLNDLMKIAEEKDEAIYKYSEAETSIFYVVNSSFIYTYKSID